MASACMSPFLEDFVPATLRPFTRASGVTPFGKGPSITIQQMGTIKWSFEDDTGRKHDVFIENSLYVPDGSERLISPQHFYTIFRMSYPHSYDPMNNPPTGHERCTMVMSEDRSNGIMEGWLDYTSTMNAVFTKEEYKSSYLYSFTSWENFFCLLTFSQNNGDNQQERLKLSKQIGFNKYLLEGYTPEELRNMFEGTTDIIAGEYPISRWDVADKSFPAYIKFIDKKWWELVELGRTVHPNLTMEVRVDIEAGNNPYDMHANDEGPPKQAYWAGYMGSKKGVPLHSETALANLGKSPIILSQFNFQGNTPHLVMRSIVLEECNEFLEKSAAVLKKYTKGYGLWAYRNYRQSEILMG